MTLSGEGGNDKAGRWREVMEEQASSDLSVRQFCTERGLAPSQFYYRRRRLGAVGTDRSLGEAGPETGRVPAFVEWDLGKSVARGGSSPLEIRLDLGGGCVLEIRRG